MADRAFGEGRSLMLISSDDIRVFYERLHLWSVIRPNGCPPSMPVRSSWQRCLDSLAFLCDTQTGGKTVSALIVQDCSDRLRYWVACNGSSGHAVEILTWLLDKLNSFPVSFDRRPLYGRILGEMVTLCDTRIDDYYRRLLRIIDAAGKGASTLGEYHIISQKSGLI
jgi:hypothetical protein